PDGRRLAALDPGARALAARPAVGARHRLGHGRGLGAAGGDRRHALVHPAPRPGHRPDDGPQRDPAARLPARAGADRDHPRRAPPGGGRWAAAAVALVALLLVPPLVLVVVRDRPIDVGLPPYGGDELEPAPDTSGSAFKAALGGLALGARSGTFWLLAFSFF